MKHTNLAETKRNNQIFPSIATVRNIKKRKSRFKIQFVFVLIYPFHSLLPINTPFSIQKRAACKLLRDKNRLFHNEI